MIKATRTLHEFQTESKLSHLKPRRKKWWKAWIGDHESKVSFNWI